MFLDKIALALAIVGGLNWGCIGLFNFDLVAFISGGSGPRPPLLCEERAGPLGPVRQSKRGGRGVLWTLASIMWPNWPWESENTKIFILVTISPNSHILNMNGGITYAEF